MINKENKEEPKTEPVKKESGYMDVAYMDVQCHILIKDKETGEILVNKRG
jgi:hypothetical protein